MEFIFLAIVGFAIYGVVAFVGNNKKNRENDAKLFRQQIRAFEVQNPDALISGALDSADRYYVRFTNDRGQAVYWFYRTHGEAIRVRHDLLKENIKAVQGWLGPSANLE